MIPLVGFGAGGHAKVMIETLRLQDQYEFIGLLDPNQALWDTEILGVSVLGDDRLIPPLYDQGIRHAFIGLGAIGDTHPRRQLYKKVRRQGFQVIQTIHPQSYIASSAEIGHGSTIMVHAVINAAATLGDNVIINSGAIVEHDCNIGNHVHIATGACLASTVRVGTGTHIGVGASVLQCLQIGQNVIVGAGAVVVKDVPDNAVVVGVPARPIEI